MKTLLVQIPVIAGIATLMEYIHAGSDVAGKLFPGMPQSILLNASIFSSTVLLLVALFYLLPLTARLILAIYRGMERVDHAATKLIISALLPIVRQVLGYLVRKYESLSHEAASGES